MGAIANITVTDSVPANHVFVPEHTHPFASWVNRGSTTSAGNRKISASLIKAEGNAIKDRVLVKFKWPIEATVDGVVTVVRESEFIGEFKHHKDATQLERDNFGAMVRDLISEAAIRAYDEDLEITY